MYIHDKHLLELIPFQHQAIFLELLRVGIELRICFRELDHFLLWEQRVRPVLAQQDIVLESVSAQVNLYLLDQQFRLDWPAADA